MSDKKFILIIILVLSLIALAALSSASLINNNSIGSNSETYEANLANLTGNFFFANFNVTQTFTGGSCGTGKTCIWVPWYSSSSFCNVTYLQEYGSINSGNKNMTRNVMVTDELSEMCLLLSTGNNQTLYDYCYNTFNAIKSNLGGTLSIWVTSRNGNTITSESNTNDTASDASARIGLSLYLASNNTLFTNATARSNYLTLANSMATDHLAYESKLQCVNSPISNRQVCRWVAGGKDVSPNFDSSPYMYEGYFPDVIKFMLMACAQSGSSTYCSAAANYTEQALVAQNYTGGTAAGNFTVAPFNFNWNLTSSPIRIFNISAVNSYYWNRANEQWDDSDAPRWLGSCDVLRYANITLSGNLTNTVYQNLSDYCNAFSRTGTFTPTTSCLQYYFNGTCKPGTQLNDFYYVGLGGQMHTYYNTSIFQGKVDQALTQYSWTDKTYNSNACYGIYRGIRPAKLLTIGLGKDEQALGLASLLLMSDTSNIEIRLVNPTNGSTLTYTNVNLTVRLTNNNITSIINSTIDPVPYTYYNQSFDGTDGSWTGTFQNLSTGGDGYLNISGNTFSPDQNLSRYSAYEQQFRIQLGQNANNVKLYFQTSIGSLSGDRWFFENTTACGYNLKFDGGAFDSIGTIPCKSNVSVIIQVNKTASLTRANVTYNNGTSQGSFLSNYVPYTANGNSSKNNNGTGVEAATSGITPDFRIYNVAIVNIGTNITNVTVTPGNGTMNTTFFNQTGGFIGQVNNTPTGSDVTVPWNLTKNATFLWYVNVTSKDALVRSYFVQFTINTSAGLPPANDTVTADELSVCSNSMTAISNFFSQTGVIMSILGAALIIIFITVIVSVVNGSATFGFEGQIDLESINWKNVIAAAIAFLLLSILAIAGILSLAAICTVPV